MKKYFFIALFLFALAASTAYAALPSTTGLISGQIWYSKEPLVEGDTVKIYTAVWNEDTDPLQARVEFYDQNVILGTRDITVPGQSLKEASVSWQITAGDHSISAKILSSSLSVDGKKKTVTLDRSTTEPDHTFVPVGTKTVLNSTTLDSEAIKEEISKVGSQVADAIPPSISENVNSFDSVRANTYTAIEKNKTDTQKKIDSFNAVKSTQVSQNTKGKVTIAVKEPAKPVNGIEKPIAYIKLFLLSLAGFIFKYKIVFYGLIAILVFLIVRFIYRKIKNR